jgi:dTDP-4-dehydrorhamnose reductase
MEIWGGVECTVARVRNKVHDQLTLNGHENRLSDLELFKDLGIKTIRYPMLWEKYEKNPQAFLLLHKKRLNKLKELDISPIAGLVHHGSGPFYTDLSQPNFPELLANYAGIIAENFPSINFYNPVNEPLTTARFSGLYGIWYPHQRSDNVFARIFVNEMKGIVLSMKKIRTINPNAKLIPTEDLCKVHSSPALQSQADYENTRRWLTYDFLTGKFNPRHSFWNYFLQSGIPEDELHFFSKNICTPFICGYNYYVTSERYLDEHKYRYPKRYHGGNGLINYADVEAVRVGATEPTGFYGLLKECWERYKLPLALTEVHLGCTREEQLRWFKEAYSTAIKLKNEGVDFRAITAWSFLGSYDWNSLLRVSIKIYESGVFDLRSAIPRATAIANLIKELNAKGNYEHPLLEIPGWWKRDIRVLFNHQEKNKDINGISLENIRPLLIIGANGSLGKAFARVCETRGIVYKLANRNQLDIASKASIETFIEKNKPWAIINAAGYTNIDRAETCPQQCFRENTLGPVLLSQACKSNNIKLVTFSTDQVFNGEKKNPYVENDITSPLNRYGESKKMAEEYLLKDNSETLIIRSSFFFNPWSNNDLLGQILTSGPSNKQIYLASDIIISPTYVPDFVHHVLDLLIDNESGIWHLSGHDEMSYYSFIQQALNMAEKNHKHIISQPYKKLNYAAERPSYSVLMSSKGIVLPPVNSSLYKYFDELNREKEKIEGKEGAEKYIFSLLSG